MPDTLPEGPAFLTHLEATLRHRKLHPKPGSHTSEQFAAGINRIAQKFGEEAIELVIEAKDEDDQRFTSEAADLLYRLLTLMVAKDIPLENVLAELQRRHAG